MKQIYVITGANGHLGSTIIRYLSREDCLVRGLLLPSENHEAFGNVKYYKGDITDLESMDVIFSGTEGYEVIVIHTAGLVSIEDKITPNLYDVNVNGTKNVISMCRKYRARRMLYVSSVHAIAEGDGKAVIHETTSFSTRVAMLLRKQRHHRPCWMLSMRGWMQSSCILPVSSGRLTTAGTT